MLGCSLGHTGFQCKRNLVPVINIRNVVPFGKPAGAEGAPATEWTGGGGVARRAPWWRWTGRRAPQVASAEPGGQAAKGLSDALAVGLRVAEQLEEQRRPGSGVVERLGDFGDAGLDLGQLPAPAMTERMLPLDHPVVVIGRDG